MTGMSKFKPVLLAALAGVFAFASTAAAQPLSTSMTTRPDAPDDAYEMRYSQGLMVSARLVDEDGAPVAGELVTFHLGADDVDTFQFADAFTSAAGVAVARLTIAKDRHGQDDFAAAAGTPEAPGKLYQVTARYTPTFEDPGCSGDAGVVVDGGVETSYCASEATHEVFVGVETSALTLAPGNELALDEEITLYATLVDENGDAPASGDEVDGNTEKPIAGRTVTFFYDLDGNGSPSLDERLGTADTASNGVAAFTFSADPAYVVAGDFATGLHAQFGGDDKYSIAGASARLLVHPGAPDPTRTLLVVDPDTLPSDGLSTATITATLVDAYANPLGVDAPSYDVGFETTQGVIGDVDYDPVTGRYETTLRSTAGTGTAEVTVLVDGAAGASVSVEFTPYGCDCDASSRSSTSGTLVLALLLLSMRTLTSRRRQR